MEVSPKSAGMSAKRLDWITDHMNRNYIDSQKIAGCQILVSRHGHPAYFKSFGHMDIESAAPMRDDAIYRIYSMSKPITSVALMQLYERGYFQLNDPVSRVLPEWRDHKVWVSGEGEAMVTRAPEQPMTFRHVLSHTGGLTYGNLLADMGDRGGHPVDKIYAELGVNRSPGETLTSFLHKLSKVPLRYEPGQQWLYSLSTDVCGGLVEVISGQPFDEYLDEHVFGPLGMVDTGFWLDASKQARLTSNYRRNPDKTLKCVDRADSGTYLKKPSFLSGGGGLLGTIADYSRFAEMLRRGGELDGERILGPRTLDMMHMNHLKGGQDLTKLAIGSFSETANEGVGFGLGFALTLGQVASGSVSNGDYYWGGAASTIFWVDPNEDLVVIFMTQLMPSATFNFRGQLKNIIYGAIEQ